MIVGTHRIRVNIIQPNKSLAQVMWNDEKWCFIDRCSDAVMVSGGVVGGIEGLYGDACVGGGVVWAEVLLEILEVAGDGDHGGIVGRECPGRDKGCQPA